MSGPFRLHQCTVQCTAVALLNVGRSVHLGWHSALPKPPAVNAGDTSLGCLLQPLRRAFKAIGTLQKTLTLHVVRAV